MKLLQNTSNLGKQAEYKRSGLSIDFVDASCDESAHSFAANALIKAQAGAMAFGLDNPQILFSGEDSGLCVGVLSGAPGIWSKRIQNYSFDKNFEMQPGRVVEETELTLNEANCHYLLEVLKRGDFFSDYPEGIPASYRIAYAICDSKGQMFDILEAECPVLIVEDYQDKAGFGYDAISIHSEIGHMGLASPEQKSSVSHRGVLIRKLKCWLEEERYKQAR